MASMNAKGLDELMNQLAKVGELATGDTAKEMLQAGAAEMVKSWKQAAIAHGHGGRGRMVEAITPKYSTQSGSMIDIYPQGTDKDGVRNAEKAFLLHYGWSGRAGDHWVDDAEQQGETATVDAMEAVFTEKMKEKGLI